MAFVPIATITTLGQMLDEVRERTNAISEEESELYRLPLINLCHDAILLVVGKQDPRTIRSFYLTEPATVTEASNLVDISGLDIASVDPDDLTYSDSLNGQALVTSLSVFENLKTIYSAAMMSSFFIAYVANITATDSKLQIRTFRGSALVTPGTLKLGFIRNPAKVTDVTKKPDCSEVVMRQAIEVVVQWIPARLKASA